jgi:hypothetical protein
MAILLSRILPTNSYFDSGSKPGVKLDHEGISTSRGASGTTNYEMCPSQFGDLNGAIVFQGF